MKLSKNDFVKVEYTGKLQETNKVFDTTSEAVAKKENIHNPKMIYGPVTICLGEKQILGALDDAIIGKEAGQTIHIKLNAEHAFGKKDAKLLRLVPQNIFTQQKIRSFVGLEVSLDGNIGLIRSVTAGRVYVDFNHPLAGKDVEYEIKIIEKIDDTQKKAESLIGLLFNISHPKTELKESKLIIHEKLPKEIAPMLQKKLNAIIPSITEVEISEEVKKSEHNHKKEQ